MAYSCDILPTVLRTRHQWIILSGVACPNDDVIYTVEGADNLVVFFKERPFSAGITYGKFPRSAPFLEALKDRLDRDSYLLTGTDGEVYGHH